MRAGSFLDTSVLVYTDDAENPQKQAQALELVADCWRRGVGVVSTQVLEEYFVAATRKLGVDPVIARRKIELFGRLHLVPIRLDDVLGAIDLYRLHQLPFWDALVVRAALVAGCQRLYSEDLRPGWRIEGLEAVDPFTRNGE